MDWLIQFVTEHAQHAHWAFFGALMLAGFSLPVSEDVVLIFGGVLASTVVPEHTMLIFFSIFLGAYLSDWVAYWIGRLLGPKLWNIRWLARIFKPEKFRRFEQYYERYGVITLLIGRFIPFGVRNCLFMTAGLAKMPFLRFALADGIACAISNTALFWTAYACGSNYQVLLNFVKKVDVLIFGAFLVAAIGFVCYKLNRRVQIQPDDDGPNTL
jgi:membrane-associated protein